jgi:undecaprenyl pyrophosphate synthase
MAIKLGSPKIEGEVDTPEHREMVAEMKKHGIPAALLYAYRKHNWIITKETEKDYSKAQLDEWKRTISEYKELNTYPYKYDDVYELTPDEVIRLKAEDEARKKSSTSYRNMIEHVEEDRKAGKESPHPSFIYAGGKTGVYLNIPKEGTELFQAFYDALREWWLLNPEED